MLRDNVAAYVINRRIYQETSLIVDLFTLQDGKLSVVAKGALRQKNDAGGLLQPFRPLMISYSGRSDLKTLKSVEISGQFNFLDSTYLYCGYYLNELVDRLLPAGEASTRLFGAYVRAINELFSKSEQNASLRLFEYALLSELGLIPSFQIDSNSNDIMADQRYVLSPERGFVLVPSSEKRQAVISDRSYSGHLLLRISDATSGEELSDFFKSQVEHLCEKGEGVQASFMVEAKLLMRHFIAKALDGAEINSRSLFKKHNIQF